MAEIILVRHGQASFGADNYDLLSDLGKHQAQWLGQHWAQLGKSVDRVVMGTMVRHRQTADAILHGFGLEQQEPGRQLETHAGFNEYDFEGLLKPLKNDFSDLWVESGHARRDYFHNMKHALAQWMSGAIVNDGQDTWLSFCSRIKAAFEFACDHPGKRFVLVTSGGPIAVILADILGLDHARTVDLIMQIKNTSTQTILYNRVNFTVDSVNDVSHLNTPDKQQHITFS